MTGYRISLIDVLERKSLIEARTKVAAEQRIEYKFRNGKEALKLIHVPIGHLVYRLENYRTRDTQLSLIAKKKYAQGFFERTRHEDASVQAAQHAILLDEAKRGSGETIQPIHRELQRVKRQTEDLIVTHEGIVVNGNRRLSAMRDLYGSDPATYQGFSEILCTVLPSTALAEEIRELEIALQMQPDTKLPYEWTAIGRAARDLRQDGKSDDEIARQMNRDKKDIARAVAKIDAANLYLTEWLKCPDDFTLLENTEQAFNQIATKNTAAGKDLNVREATRAFDFFLIEQRDSIVDRSAYTFINVIEDNPEAFLTQVAAELGIDLKKKPATNPAMQHAIQFDDDVLEETDYEPLLETLQRLRGDDKARKETSLTVQAVCNAVSEQGKNRDKAALNFAAEALKKLNSIDLPTAGVETYADIRSKLIGIGERIENLHTTLDSLTLPSK